VIRYVTYLPHVLYIVMYFNIFTVIFLKLNHSHIFS
jgi:hypothetical protein